MTPRRSPRILSGLVAAAMIGGLSLYGVGRAQPAGPGVVPPPGPVVAPPPAPGPNAPPPAEEAPPAPPPGQTASPALPPGEAAPPLAAVSAEPEKPAASTPLPDKTPTPVKRPRRNEAIIQALDKITAQTVRFPADVNKPVRWKDLVFTVHACEEAAADEIQKGSMAHMEIYSEPKVGPGRTPPPAKLVYRGWMYAESPSVHPFEHPIYDVWLIACRTV